MEALQRFCALFDAGRYWDAHEALEDRWRDDRDSLWRGLIQVAAGFVHVQAERWRQADAVLARALGHLRPHLPAARGVDVAGVVAAVEAARTAIAGRRRPPAPSMSALVTSDG